VIVLPALVLIVAWWVERGRRRWAALATLGGIGVASYIWLVAEGLAGDLTWVVDFFETSNPVYRASSSITPDYLSPDGATWVLHALWIAIAAALVVWGYRSERGGPRSGYSVEPELEPLVVEPEPEPDPEPDDSEPSTSRTPLPSSLQAAPVNAATTASDASARFVPFRMTPPL
jgi:hypothetical protein